VRAERLSIAGKTTCETSAVPADSVALAVVASASAFMASGQLPSDPLLVGKRTANLNCLFSCLSEFAVALAWLAAFGNIDDR
jgi:hypothetical protein